MVYLKQLRLVLWKNSLIRRRHWVLTLFEIFLPIILFVLVSYSRSKMSAIAKQEIIEPTYTDPIHLGNHADIYYKNFDISSTLFYFAPLNNFTDELMNRFQKKLEFHSNALSAFETKEDLQNEFLNVNQPVVAIIFKSNDTKKLDYDISVYNQHFRTERNDLFISDILYSDSGPNSYFQNGFITFQTTLDLSYIEMMKNETVPVYLTIQEFPYPPYKKDDGLIQIFMPFLSHITIFSFIFLCPALIMRIIEEKSSGTRELLKMVGLKCWMLWLGWFLHSFLPNIISLGLIVMLMKVPMWGNDTPPIEYCQSDIFFVFLLLYLISSITFCFAISSLFRRPFFGVVIGIAAWILSYAIPEGLISNSNLGKTFKLLLALFPNMCLSYGYKSIASYEAREIGVNWTNLVEAITESSDEITMGTVWIMFLVDIVFYMLITLYISNVFPGPYGIPRTWDFPLHYLKMLLSKNNKIINGDGSEPLDSSNSHSENGIEIRHLRKTFGNTVAVNNLSMDIKKNQITVLLGHNGAGKTTTMLMLTGMINCTKGKIKVHDYDIKIDEKEVRQLIGLCPQHNLLFNDLTVYEHLILIGGLKGSSKMDLEQEAAYLLKVLKLDKKNDSMVSSLSGGMKRKLCLAMAVIGHSQVLILDEPTAGMDPESQREVWNLLLKWRGTKTILISTHYMDEADALADWIAIMANGEKQCFGTPMELKDQFKTGYHLSLMVINTEYLDEITNTIRDVVPAAKLKEKHGNNVVFILPIEDKRNFAKLLNVLGERKDEFNISNISINITTLEDVFLSSRKEIEPTFDSEEYTKTDLNLPTLPSTFLPLLLKRVYFLFEKPLPYLIPVIFTLALTILTIYLGQLPNAPSRPDLFRLDLDLGLYGRTGVFYSSNFEPDATKNSIVFVEKLKSMYQKEANFQKGITIEVNSTSEGIITKGKQNLPYYKQHLIIAAEFNVSKNEITANAMYSHFAVHAAPISLNLILNSIAKCQLGPDYSISMSNIPLKKVEQVVSSEKSQVQVGLLWLIMFPLGLAFFIACFILFPHMELSTGFIQLQIMCGASSFKYWFSNFLFDFVFYVMSTFLIVCITWALTIICHWNDFSNAMSPLPVIMIFHGMASIPFVYLFTRFKTASSGYATLLIVSLLSGVILTTIVYVLENSKDDYHIKIGEALRHIFLVFFPQFGVSYVSINYSRKVVENYNWYTMSAQKRAAQCRFHGNPCCYEDTTAACIKYKDYFMNEEVGIWRDLWKMVFPCILYFTVNVVLNSEYYKIVAEEINKLIYRRTPSSDSLTKKDMLYTDNLTKYIKGEQIVKAVQFEVGRGKCYGLLGVNGAGKTTTFRMLTKEIMKSDGRAAVFKNGKGNVEDEESRIYLQQIGYCPQNNCLNFALTARQLLKIFAYFRGYDYKYLDDVANHFLKMMQLENLADKPCGVYSGGNKRKLCLALALMGYPPNIFLDEPTNGVDPVSRRIFWSIIKEMQTQKQLTFLLTSHSMQECEALCSKLGIMKDGQLECNDTIPQLKEKYHTGFTVKLKLKEKHNGNGKSQDRVSVRNETRRSKRTGGQDFPDAIAMKSIYEKIPAGNYSGNGNSKKFEYFNGDVIDSLDYVKHVLENEYDGILKDEHPGLLHYHVKAMDSSRNTMSKLFEDMENLKNRCSLIEDYIVTETTVEDVFLTVAKADSSSDSSNKTSSDKNSKNSSDKDSKTSSKKTSKSSSEASSKSYMV